MDIESSLAYLEKIPSARVRRSILNDFDAPPADIKTDNLAAPETDREAGVIESQLVAFTSGLESKYKEAVKYSTQIAQRAADNKFDQINQRLDWYKTYAETLQHAGWIGSDNKLTEYKNSNVEITMEDVAIELIKLAAGPNAALIVELTSATINSLKNDSDVLSKLQASSSSGSSGSFDILPCLQKDDDVVMYNHAMVFKHSSSSGGFWFWSWKMSQVSLRHAANEWTLNYSHYQKVEEAIKNNLGESSNNFFNTLNLA